jgi:hypothetical protein
LQVGGLIRLTSGAVLSFGLAHYGSSEFELMAEELLMSDSVIKVSKQSYNAYFSWNNSTSLLLYKLTIFFIYFLFFFPFLSETISYKPRQSKIFHIA